MIYALGREAWGHGLATEAAARVVEHAFDALDLDRVIALVVPENAASSRVLEELGARPDGAITRFDAELLRYVVLKGA